MATTFHLGALSIDAVQYGSQGNAVLGIRDSGKTYTATYMAERLFEAGIPFIAFDPIGVWRYLRVPGAQRGGKGYPVVVAGGQEGDLPLTVNGAPEIVRAAMHNGVSLVIDLFDIKLSKADWRRIVTACVRVLLHENQKHGLRHVFIEEAAEFIPQRPIDWDVYAEIEKLARMGGNARLGYTLINQRSQEVSKAILELCENVFLHRQRGKNALENMDKWLSIAGATEQKEIIRSLPELPQGQCWAWVGGDKPRPPLLVEVPRKNSLHPDRRVMRGDESVKAKGAVDVGQFVDGMKTTLVTVEAEVKANDPKALRAEIGRLKSDIQKLSVAKTNDNRPDPKAIEEAELRGATAGKRQALQAIGKFASDLATSVGRAAAACADAQGVLSSYAAFIDTQAQAIPVLPHRAVASRPAPPKPNFLANRQPVNGHDQSVSRSEQKIIDAIRWWNVLGIATPSHPQVGFIAGYSHKSGTWATYLSRLRSQGMIEGRGDLVLTKEGLAAANDPDTPPSGEALRTTVLAKLDGPLTRILSPIIDAYPKGIDHPNAGERSGYSHTSGTWATYLSRLRSLDLIDGRGELKAQDWLFP